MIKLLIMDAGGVVNNRAEKFSDRLVREFSADKAKVTEFFSTALQDCLVGKADLKESVKPYLPSFGWKGAVDELLDYWFESERSVDEALLRYLQQLRQSGVRVVLAANQEKYRTQYMLEQMGVDGKFDKIYFSAHLGLKKPAAEFFARIIEDMGINKDEAVLWDDEQVNIDGALAYGIDARLYTDYDSFLQMMQREYGMPAPDASVSTAA